MSSRSRRSLPIREATVNETTTHEPSTDQAQCATSPESDHTTKEAERLFQILLDGRLEQVAYLVSGDSERDCRLRGQLVGKATATWEEVESVRLCDTFSEHKAIIEQLRTKNILPSDARRSQKRKPRDVSLMEFVRSSMHEFLKAQFPNNVDMFINEQYDRTQPSSSKNPIISDKVVLACHGFSRKDYLNRGNKKLWLDTPFRKALFSEIVRVVESKELNAGYHKTRKRATMEICRPIFQTLKAEREQKVAAAAAAVEQQFEAIVPPQKNMCSPEIDYVKEFCHENSPFFAKLKSKIEQPGAFLPGEVTTSSLGESMPKHPSITFHFSDGNNNSETKTSSTKKTRRKKGKGQPKQDEEEVHDECDEEGNAMAPTFHYTIVNPMTKHQLEQFLNDANEAGFVKGNRGKNTLVMACCDTDRLKGEKHDFFIGGTHRYESAPALESNFAKTCFRVGRKLSDTIHDCVCEVLGEKYPERDAEILKENDATSFYALFGPLDDATQGYHCDGDCMNQRSGSETTPIEVSEGVYLPTPRSMLINTMVVANDAAGCCSSLAHTVNHSNETVIDLNNRTEDGEMGTTSREGYYVVIHGQGYGSQVPGRKHQSLKSTLVGTKHKRRQIVARGVITFRSFFNPGFNGLDAYEKRVRGLAKKGSGLTTVPYTNVRTGIISKLSTLQQGSVLDSGDSTVATGNTDVPTKGNPASSKNKNAGNRRSKKARTEAAATYHGEKFLIDESLKDSYANIPQDDYDKLNIYIPGKTAELKSQRLLAFLQSEDVFPYLMEHNLLLRFEVQHESTDTIEIRDHLFTSTGENGDRSVVLPGMVFMRGQIQDLFGFESNHRFTKFMRHTSRSTKASDDAQIILHITGADYFPPAFLLKRFYKSHFLHIMEHLSNDYANYSVQDSAWSTVRIRWTISGGNEDTAGVNTPNPASAHKTDASIMVAGGQSWSSDQVKYLTELAGTGRIFPVFIDLRDYFKGVPNIDRFDLPEPIINRQTTDEDKHLLYCGSFSFDTAGFHREMDQNELALLQEAAGEANVKFQEWATERHFWCDAKVAVTQKQWGKLKDEPELFKPILIKRSQANFKVKVQLEPGAKHSSRPEMIKRWFDLGLYKQFLEEPDDNAQSDETAIDAAMGEVQKTTCTFLQLGIAMGLNSVGNAHRYVGNSITGPPESEKMLAKPIGDLRLPTKIRTNPSPNTTHSLEPRIVFLRNAVAERYPQSDLSEGKRLPVPTKSDVNGLEQLRNTIGMAALFRMTGRMGFYRLWRLLKKMKCDIPIPEEYDEFIDFLNDCAVGSTEAPMNFGHKYLITRQHDASIPSLLYSLTGLISFLQKLRSNLTTALLKNMLCQNDFAKVKTKLIGVINTCVDNDGTGSIGFCAWKILADVAEIYDAPFGVPLGKDATPGVGAKGGMVLFKNGNPQWKKKTAGELIDMLVEFMHNEDPDKSEVVADSVLEARGLYRDHETHKVRHKYGDRAYNAVCAEQDFCKLLVEASKCWPSRAGSKRPKCHAVHLYPFRLPGPRLVDHENLTRVFLNIILGFDHLMLDAESGEWECPDFMLMDGENIPVGWFIRHLVE